MSNAAIDGIELDYAVAMAGEVWKTAHLMYPTMTLDPTFKGVEIRGQWCMLVPNNDFRQDPQIWSPSTNWQQGGPIIESAKISLYGDAGGRWMAQKHNIKIWGETILIAGMRCFVEWKRER